MTAQKTQGKLKHDSRYIAEIFSPVASHNGVKPNPILMRKRHRNAVGKNDSNVSKKNVGMMRLKRTKPKISC